MYSAKLKMNFNAIEFVSFIIELNPEVFDVLYAMNYGGNQPNY